MWHPYVDELMGFLDLTSLKKKYRVQYKNQKSSKENAQKPIFLMAEILQFIWSIFIDIENLTSDAAKKKN